MKSRPSSSNMESRIATLESRLAALEKRIEKELPEIPWPVLCLAVAAVFPRAQIIHVAAIGDARTSPATQQNLWCIGGRMELFRSHRIR